MWYSQEGELTILWVYVQPGAKSNEITGLYEDALKIRLKALPIEGQANKALQKYLAQCLQVPMKQIRLVQGEKTRKKRFEITGVSICLDSLFNK